jgi:hypothetical protein
MKACKASATKPASAQTARAPPLRQGNLCIAFRQLISIGSRDHARDEIDAYQCVVPG